MTQLLKKIGVLGMDVSQPRQPFAMLMGISAGFITFLVLPWLEWGIFWSIIAITALCGYVGTLLPDIDNEYSIAYRIVKRLSYSATLILPFIQFSYRPTDLVIALVVGLFFTRQFWELLHLLVKQGGHTHSVIAAVCLSLGVAWIAYLTIGSLVVVPAFLACSTGYILHLFLEDHQNTSSNQTEVYYLALTATGKGHSVELFGLLAIGMFSFIGMWGF